jgi:putative peptidoglycan lipid II flippase
MVNKILSFLNKEMPGLHQAAFLLGFFALLSQILALVRDKLLAFTFGANASLDLYYASFRVPDFLFVTVGSLVSMSILIPFLVEAEGHGKDKAQEFLNSVFTFYVVFLGVVSIIVFFVLPFILPKLFPGIRGVDMNTLVLTTRILLMSPILLGISNLFGSLTQSHQRFLVYALSPLLYNLGIIIGLLFFYPHFGLIGLVLGVILGALLHILIQVPSAIHIGYVPRFTFKPDFAVIRKLALLSFPRTITLSINHVAIFFMLSIASLMAAGSISVFNLAFNLQSVPLSIIGVSYSLAAFPTLSRLYVNGQKESFLQQFVSSAQHIIFWSVPCSILFIVLRAHIVRVVLGAGKFDWNDTRLTAAALALFVVSLVFQALILLFVRGLYAIGTTGKPFYINLVSGGIMIVSSYCFYKAFLQFVTFRFFFEALFKVPDIQGASVLMLPLGFTLGSIIDGILMWMLFSRYVKGFSREIFRTLFQSFSASVIMGFAIFLSLRVFDNIFSLDTFLGVFLQGLFSGIIGIIVCLLILKLLKSKELSDITRVIQQKIWKAKIISPDSQVV